MIEVRHITALLVTVGLMVGGLQMFRAQRPVLLTVAGNTRGTPLQDAGISFGVTVCPPAGAKALAMAFISDVNTTDGAGTSATLVVENHTDASTMCDLTVPCTIPKGATVSASCDGDVLCDPGDTIHIEWYSSDCDSGHFPQGAASGTLQEF